MAAAVFHPRSLAMMKTLAMQGMNRVMVTIATTSCTTSRAPARDMSKSRVAAKSRRRKPIRKADDASAGSPRMPVTSGLPARVITSRRRKRSRTNRTNVPRRNSGRASLRYHSTRVTVFESTFSEARAAAWAAARRRSRPAPRAASGPPASPPAAAPPTTAHEPDRRRLGGDHRQHREDDAQLRRARDAQGQEEGGQHPLLARGQDPGGEGGHGVAAQAQDHGQHGLAVEAHDPEDPVAHHREAREVARVLEDREGGEERGHDGQDDGEAVGEAHGDEAVLPHEQVAHERPGHESEERRRPGTQVALEDVGLEEIDQRAGPEDARRTRRAPRGPRRGWASPRPDGRPRARGDGRRPSRRARPRSQTGAPACRRGPAGLRGIAPERRAPRRATSRRGSAARGPGRPPPPATAGGSAAGGPR